MIAAGTRDAPHRCMDDKQHIVPESPQHDEQPLEHVRSLAPQQPSDPKPVVDDEEMPIPVPAGPIV